MHFLFFLKLIQMYISAYFPSLLSRRTALSRYSIAQSSSPAAQWLQTFQTRACLRNNVSLPITYLLSLPPLTPDKTAPEFSKNKIFALRLIFCCCSKTHQLCIHTNVHAPMHTCTFMHTLSGIMKYTVL